MQIDEISKHHSPEIALIVICCRVFLKTASPIELETFVQTHAIDWPAVYQFSITHRIRPVVYHVLSSVRIPVSAEVSRQFRNYCHSFSVFAFDRQMESVRIQQLLRQKGVPVRMYKGLDFSLTAYNGDISMREFTDMDLIINIQDVSAVVELMRSEGYRCNGMEYFRRFSARFLTSHKDICFQKRCPRGRIFSFEFHYRPVKYIMNVACSFPDILGPDYLSSTAPLTHQQYYQLMLLNHGGSDYYPDFRSLLDLAMLERGSVPKQLQRFEKLWQLLSAQLLNYPDQLSFVSADRALQRVARIRAKRLLSVKTSKTFFDTVRMHIRFSEYAGTKLRLLIKTVQFLLLPNENDIDSLKLPYFSLYYFTKPFRLIKGVLSVRKVNK
jgi:hypothetical protein